MVSAYPRYPEGCVCSFTSWAFLPVTLSTCTGASLLPPVLGGEIMNDFHEAPNLDRYFFCRYYFCALTVSNCKYGVWCAEGH